MTNCPTHDDKNSSAKDHDEKTHCFDDQVAASHAAKELGCKGFHEHGNCIMPCNTHAEYQKHHTKDQ